MQMHYYVEVVFCRRENMQPSLVQHRCFLSVDCCKSRLNPGRIISRTKSAELHGEVTPVGEIFKSNRTSQKLATDCCIGVQLIATINMWANLICHFLPLFLLTYMNMKFNFVACCAFFMNCPTNKLNLLLISIEKKNIGIFRLAEPWVILFPQFIDVKHFVLQTAWSVYP